LPKLPESPTLILALDVITAPVERPKTTNTQGRPHLGVLEHELYIMRAVLAPALLHLYVDADGQAHGDRLIVECRRFIAPIGDRLLPAFGESWPRRFRANRFHKSDLFDLS